MRYLIFLFISAILMSSLSFASPEFPKGSDQVQILKTPGVRSEILKNITPLVQASIAAGNYPGAVIIVSHHGKRIYQGVFGSRRVIPNVRPMELNTIFDLASLTKVIATTPAVMQLAERGFIDIDAPVAQYWPAFAKNGKETITVREMLTHTSGLQPDISLSTKGKQDALDQIIQLRPTQKPGSAFLYSDVNFIVLAYLVERISHEPFNEYVHQHIYQPLKMLHTTFLPSKNLRDQIAPTEIIQDKLRWGEVHDPTAYAMGGVAGDAGLFSTANDLAIYAQSLLDSGRIHNTHQHFLSPLTVLKMTSVETPKNMDERAFGWDIDSAYSNRGVFLPVHSFGHTGFTGTSLWIDPSTQTYIIILTSRTHPLPSSSNVLIEDRKMIANLVASSLTDVSAYRVQNTHQGELNRAYR